MNRTVKRGDATIDVDLGSAWKLYDNNNINKSIVIYYGPIFKTKERVFWMETDKGGVVINPSDDLKCISEFTGLSEYTLQTILQDPKNKYQDIKIH
jgi:hypothetical protein